MGEVTATQLYKEGACSVMDIQVIQSLITEYKFPIEMFMFSDKYLPCVEVLPKVYHPLSDYVSYVRGILPEVSLESLQKFPYTLSSLDVMYRKDFSGYEETEIAEFSIDGISTFEEYITLLKRKNRSNVRNYAKSLQDSYTVSNFLTDAEFAESTEWYRDKWSKNTPDYGIPCYEKWYEKSCIFVNVALRHNLMELIAVRDKVTMEIVSVSVWECYNDTYYGVWFSLNPKYSNRPLGHLTIVAGIREAFSKNLKRVCMGNCSNFPYKRIYLPNKSVKAYNYLNER